MDLDYVVTATNEMFATLSRSPEPTPADLQRAFMIGCRALTRLQQDDAFLKAARSLAQRRTSHRKAFEAIIANVEHFTQGFLVIERKVMLAANVSESTWSYLVRFAMDVRSQVARTTIDVDSLRKTVGGLRRLTCELADQLDETVRDSQRTKAVHKALGRVGMGLGGAAMIGVNASALAATLGLSMPGSAVSAAVGTGLITKAFEGGAA